MKQIAGIQQQQQQQHQQYLLEKIEEQTLLRSLV
jgi:hypothetical protein